MSGYAQMQMHAALGRYLRWPKVGASSRTRLPRERLGRSYPETGPGTSSAEGLETRRNDEGDTHPEPSGFDR